VLFFDRLAATLARAAADAERGVAGPKPAVFLIDIDRFRQVNESLGLATGDSILLTVARRLGRLLRPVDTLARIDGDQFGIILLSEQGEEAHTAFAESVKRAIRAAIAFGGQEIFLTVSIGVALPESEACE